jgi:hypothetical protein
MSFADPLAAQTERDGYPPAARADPRRGELDRGSQSTSTSIILCAQARHRCRSFRPASSHSGLFAD